MTKLKRLLLVCGVVSSVLYIAVDILGTQRYPGYSYTVQEFSELTAAGAPTRDLMVALNVIPYDLLVAAFAVGVWISAGQKRTAHHRSHAHRIRGRRLRYAASLLGESHSMSLHNIRYGITLHSGKVYHKC